MSPRVYSTDFNADVDVETQMHMPALVLTHSSSSIDSSAPSTPVTESGRPFEFDKRADNLKASVEVPISSQTGSSPTRRCYPTARREVVKTNNSIQLIQMLFLLAMLLVDVLRVLSWVPICLWTIMGEVWVVAKHELQSRNIDVNLKKAAGGTVAVVAMTVGFLLL